MKSIRLPLGESAAALRAGDRVLLSGRVITARDAAHRRICDMLARGEPLPFSLAGETVYYAGPCPAPEGRASGSCGPTTSGRVDVFTPLLLQNGLIGMIGKGDRSPEVYRAMRTAGAVYFAAIGGAGALYGAAVRKSEVIAFPELLSEAVHALEIEDFPVLVAIDAGGANIYGHE